MKKIVMVRHVAVGTNTLVAGNVYEAEEEFADELISKGQAEPYDGDVDPKAVEKAREFTKEPETSKKADITEQPDVKGPLVEGQPKLVEITKVETTKAVVREGQEAPADETVKLKEVEEDLRVERANVASQQPKAKPQPQQKS